MNQDTQRAILAAAGRYVRSLLGPLEKRLEDQERRVIPEAIKGDPGAPGKDGQPPPEAVVRKMVEDLVSEKVSGINLDLAGVASEAVSKAIADLPPPASGKDGEAGKDGESVTPEQISKILDEAIERRVSAWALDFERRASGVLERAVDRMPRPADGAPGRDGVDGRDGVGFDDIECAFDGDRTVTVRFIRGGVVKEFPFKVPTVLDRGVFKEGFSYERGDGATWGGSFWIAQADTKSKPDSGDGTWRLAVKKGRDGRDGAPGKDFRPAIPVKVSP